MRILFKDYNLIKTIKFCWISSHVNIPGNERAESTDGLIAIWGLG